MDSYKYTSAWIKSRSNLLLKDSIPGPLNLITVDTGIALRHHKTPDVMNQAMYEMMADDKRKVVERTK